MFDVVSTLFESRRTRVHITVDAKHYMVLCSRPAMSYGHEEWFTDIVTCDDKGKITGYTVVDPGWRRHLTPDTYKDAIAELVTNYHWSEPNYFNNP